uniref:Uncharacterized protein n=1 Tax=Myoviridae sp. ctNQV2 TaxID=2827683 RepID=A0A8S5RZL1_9CAUD|nr:MAG TPA: hypothetical protein [Myoviridae sp. ctNQV2]
MCYYTQAFLYVLPRIKFVPSPHYLIYVNIRS